MNSESNAFMPLIACARGGYSPHKDSKGQPHVMLRPSVITMGSPLHATKDRGNTFCGIVEGNRTGQRRSVSNDLIVRGLENKIDSLRRELASVSEELQTAREKARKKSKDEQKIRRKLSMMSVELEEETARRILTIKELFQVMEFECDFFWKENVRRQRLLNKAEMNCNDMTNELDAARQFKQHAEQMQQQKILNLENENKALQQKVEKLEKRNTFLEAACDAKHAMEREMMQTQEQLQRTTKELSDAQKAIASSELTTKQVQLFVQLICQPNFNVVKDQSLTPVDKDRPDPSGFVLVPLPIMLHGYALLPPSDRRNIIELYEVHL